MNRTSWPPAVRLYLASFLIVGMAISMLGPALTELRDRSGAGIGSIGVLFAGQCVGYIVGSFGGGRFYDRIDGHRVFAGGLVLMGIGLALVPAFDSLTQLFVTFVVLGIGGGAADTGANTMLMWALGARSGRAMNALHMCFGLGALAVPLLVHVDLDVTTRVAAILCGVLALWAVRIDAPTRAPQARAEHAEATRAMLLVAFLFFVVYVGLELGFAGWIKTYGEEIGFSDLAATWLTTCFWIGFTLGRLVASAIADRFTPESILYLASGMSIASAVVMIVGGGATVPVWVGTVLMGVATAPQFPGMMTLAERRIHISGSATAWFVAGAGAGGLVFPMTIGAFFDAQGAGALPWAALLLALATFAALAWADRTMGSPPKAGPVTQAEPAVAVE